MELLGLAGGATGSFLTAAISFLFILTIVVFIHELGHFLVGRWCGVGVTAFSIGFGRELIGWNDRHGTRWKISAIPLGGYVKFAGDVNGASVPDPDALARMTAAERAISFHHKSVAKRAAIVAAGPAANFILAIAVFAGVIYVNGRYVVTPRIQAVHAGSAAERAGFQPDDLVVSINGRAITGFADMQRIISSSAGDTLEVAVERDGQPVTLQAVPDTKETQTPFGKQRIGLLGLEGSRDPADVKLTTYGLLESLRLGAAETWYVVERTIAYIGKLLVGRESADQVSGPLGIAMVSGTVASIGGLNGLISLVAVLSVSIGLINLFPIPLLDGGHLLFYVIEAVRGRPLSDRAQEIGFRIGLAIVVMLMLFATWNDVMHRILPTLLPRGT
ncbi:MAG TPA: RIP metalloprotease RseP [Beijerinckiaceae bacterium]|jgi:regulator of sigma E protease